MGEKPDMASPARRVALLHLRTRRDHDPRYQRQLDALNGGAVAAVAALGWTSSLVASAEESDAATLDAARLADLVVLLGGEDVDPRLYGSTSAYPGGGRHESRADRLHIRVLLEAMGRGTPVLGICRGHQLINVALGGSLLRHVEGHRQAGEDPFVTTPLVGMPGPLLCTHHQAVDQPGQGLRVTARSADGLVEAVEHETAPVLGVQWHPEHPTVASSQLTSLLLRLDGMREGAARTAQLA